MPTPKEWVEYAARSLDRLARREDAFPSVPVTGPDDRCRHGVMHITERGHRQLHEQGHTGRFPRGHEFGAFEDYEGRQAPSPYPLPENGEVRDPATWPSRPVDC